MLRGLADTFDVADRSNDRTVLRPCCARWCRCSLMSLRPFARLVDGVETAVDAGDVVAGTTSNGVGLIVVLVG